MSVERGAPARLVEEFAIEVTWVDHVKAGAKEPTSIHGWLQDRTRIDTMRDSYRRDRAIQATRVLTRQAVYTEPVEHEPLEVITPEIREDALDRMFKQVMKR